MDHFHLPLRELGVGGERDGLVENGWCVTSPIYVGVYVCVCVGVCV